MCDRSTIEILGYFYQYCMTYCNGEGKDSQTRGRGWSQLAANELSHGVRKSTVQSIHNTYQKHLSSKNHNV